MSDISIEVAGLGKQFQIGSLQKMLDSLGALDLPASTRTAIMGGNAARLLGLDG